MNNIKGSVGAIVLVVLAIAVLAFVFLSNKNTNPKSTPKMTDSVLTGNVTYLSRIALPSGSVIEVKLSDVSRQDVPADVVGETTIVTQGENVPIPFEIAYDSSKIDERLTYAVSARILVGGELRWTNTDHIPVLTQGNPSSEVEILVRNVNTSSGVEGGLNLEGTTFRLASFNGKEIPQGENYTLSFEGGSVSAKFCNNMGGDYALENGIFSGLIISTLMYCATPEGLMDMESAFSKIVMDGANLSLSGSTLTLAGGDTEMVFTVFMD